MLGTIVGWVSKIVSFGSGVISKIAGLFGGGGGSASVSGYATGGFTRGPSIAGEDPRYPTEAVISFNPAYRSQNLSYGAVDDPKDITTKEYVDAADNALKVKVDALWDFVCTDITSNPFQITFDDLEGLTVRSGIWNTGQRRLEC